MISSRNETLRLVPTYSEEPMARLEIPTVKPGKPLIPSNQSLDKYTDSRVSIQDSPTASINCESMLNHQDPRLELELGLENSQDSFQNLEDMDSYEQDQSGSFSSITQVDTSMSKVTKQKSEQTYSGTGTHSKTQGGAKKKAATISLDKAKKSADGVPGAKSTSLKTLIDVYQPEEIIKEASIYEENETSTPMKKQEKILEVKSLLEFSRNMKAREGNQMEKGIFGTFKIKELREYLKQNH